MSWTKKQLLKMRCNIHLAVEALCDEDAVETPELFERWKPDNIYNLGDRVCYIDKLYKCVQGHTSQANWTPDITPALWTLVSVEEWPEWVQPTGAQDAYNEGDKVSHNDKHWVSETDANVWEPGVYGWIENE